jgi:hypothetical protein
MSGSVGEGDDLQERLLKELVASFPPGERPAVLARLLDEIERLHRENGAPVPAWVRRLRERPDGEPDGARSEE